MARVTVEDCVERIPNPFDLTIMAATRARQIGAGAPLTVEADNDKMTVVSLREIAAASIDLEALQESAIVSMQKYTASDEPDDDIMDFLSEEENLIAHEAQQKELETFEIDEEYVSEDDEDADTLEAETSEEE